ncbi:MAG: PH domain-containing protein [Oscillospiraceae bacterium]|nr:PH domain-containing protein [Oscillospiraceae bacterium]
MAKDKTREELVWSDRKRTFLGLPWSFTRYALSEEVLYITRGLFTTTEDEIRLYRILDVSLKQTLGQKMLGVGSIHVCSSDKTMGDFTIHSVKDPGQVKRTLSDLVEKERMAKRVASREYISGHDFDDDDDFHDGYDGHP